MKKVTGEIYVRALGCHEFEFFVEDDTTEEEIREKVENACDYDIDYTVEPGYKKRMVEQYYKETF